MNKSTPPFKALLYVLSCKAALLGLCFVVGVLIPTKSPEAATLQLQASESSYSLGSQVEYLEDRDGTLDISIIFNQPEQAWQGHSADIPSFGFTNSAFWFRLTLVAGEQQFRLLDISHPLLDEVSLFLASEGRLIQQIHTGDLRLYRDRPLNRLGFVFPVTIEADKPLTLYLRVKSAGSLQVPMKLWSEKAFHDNDEVVMSAIGIYFGVILSLLLYNLFLYLRVFEPAYIYYVLYVLMFGLFIAGLTGWGYKFLWPEAIGFQQYGLAIFICMGSIFVCRFVHYFLDLPNNAPPHRKIAGRSGSTVAVYARTAPLHLLPHDSAGSAGYDHRHLVNSALCRGYAMAKG